MALFDINKLKDNALAAGTKLSQTAQAAGQKAKDVSGELTNKAIVKLLQGVNLDSLLQNVEEYQRKTGRDASKLTDFINRLKDFQQDGEFEHAE